MEIKHQKCLTVILVYISFTALQGDHPKYPSRWLKFEVMALKEEERISCIAATKTRPEAAQAKGSEIPGRHYHGNCPRVSLSTRQRINNHKYINALILLLMRRLSRSFVKYHGSFSTVTGSVLDRVENSALLCVVLLLHVEIL